MRTKYKEAHRLARLNRRNGKWLCNPVRLEDGWPGLFVGPAGQLVEFNRLDADESVMFIPAKARAC